MRWPYVATVLVLGGHAWAEPEPQPPVEPAPAADQQPAEPVPATSPAVVTPEPAPIKKTEPALPPTFPAPPPIEGEGFRFGSYGRAIAGTDLRGGKPEKVNIVAHGPRI